MRVAGARRRYHRAMATSTADLERAATPAARTARALPRAHPLGTTLMHSVALAAGYLALDAGSAQFWLEPVPVKPWNPQAGLAVALVTAGGLRLVPALFAGALAAEMLLRSQHEPFATQLAGAAVVTLALGLVAVALRARGFARWPPSVTAMRDFFVVVALGATVSAVGYVLVAMAAQDMGYAGFGHSVLHKWLGDAGGIVCLAPLVMLALAPPGARAAPPPPPRAWLDVAAFVASSAIIVAVVINAGPFPGERMFYLLFLPLIVVAVRRGLPGAAVAVAAAQVAIVIALRVDGRSAVDAASYQVLVLVLGATTLMLGCVAGERRRSQRELARRSAELRAQQQALSDAMRVAAASETASTLAHEMSQPLSAIGTYARAGLEMLRRGSGTDAGLRDVLERIVAESARTRESVQRIREFFRTGVVRRERVAVATLARAAQDALRDRLEAAGIALSIDVPPGLPDVDVDRVQVGTVLHNIVGNAIDVLADAPPPRWIRIAATVDGSSVAVEVADSGPGIDPSIREALFEPLATTKPTGMGLGLPIARTLVQAHGGRLTLAHAHPTTFRFTLPIHGHDDS